MSTTTDQLSALSGHHGEEISVGGKPTRIWAADVVCVNPDGTIDCRRIASRASKAQIPVPAGLPTPKLADRVLVCDLNGDPRTPIVLAAVSKTIPVVTGSKGGNAALTSLLDALAADGLIVDSTT